MARMHGSNVRAYLGSRDISPDAMAINPEFASDDHDVTTFADAGWRTGDCGFLSWMATVEVLYDPSSGGIGQQLESIGVGTAGLGVLSIYDGDADGIGDTGLLFGEAVIEKRSEPKSIADMMKLTASLKGNGRAGLFGKLLHPLGSDTVSTNSASLDNSASSANGGRGTLHVTVCTGTWTIKIEHSTDNSTWASLITFTAATGATSQTVEVTGTVNRYLRVTSSEDVAGTATFVCGFARY